VTDLRATVHGLAEFENLGLLGPDPEGHWHATLSALLDGYRKRSILVGDQANARAGRHLLAGGRHLGFPDHDDHIDARLLSGCALERVGYLQRAGLRSKRVRRTSIELVSHPVVRRAVPFVAVATAVPENRKAAGVPAVRLARGIGVGLGIVQEHSGLVRGSAVIDLVEDEVGTRDVLPIHWDVQGLGSEVGHRRGWAWEEALATA
jgi:hypothetical protein